MLSSERIDKDQIVQVFKLDVESPKKVNINKKHGDGRIYKVDFKNHDVEVYIIDTPQCREITCNPHIVGRCLEARSSATAKFSIKILEDLINPETPLLILNILRAGPGYMISRALEDASKKFYQAWIRTKYVQSSYRDHIERRLKIIYEDLSHIPARCKVNLLVPDTFATGTSADVAIKRTVQALDAVESKVEKVFLYGFISQDAIQYLLKSFNNYDMRFIVLALENIMELAWNNYDMAIYGLDLSYYERFKKIRKISSIIPEEVLEDCLPYYAPGSDQPGDFSSRQSILFNGERWEISPVFSHLLNSLILIRNLKKISCDQPWYHHEEIFKEKENQLGKACLRYLPNSLLCPKESLSSVSSFLKP
ncbi:MAG: hypothetical protein QXJ17_07160 [Nitrososphaeria archaeon]